MNCKRNLLLFLFLRRRRRRRRRKHRFLVRHILLNRHDIGEYKLFQEMFDKDHESFFRYFRMAPEQFQHILSAVGPSISKETIEDFSGRTC